MPIKMPDDVVETVAKWLEAGDGSVGLCLLCGERILSEEDLVPGTNQHRCAS